MNALWRLLTSTRLAIVLSLLIVATALTGTFILSAYAEELGGIDTTIFFDWLFETGAARLDLTWWLFLLLALVGLMALSTVASVIDGLAAIAARRREGRAVARRLLSQAVHLGFVVTLMGHLVSSSTGLRTLGNELDEGATMAMPGSPALTLRLNRLDVSYSQRGGMAQMDAAVTLLEGDRAIKDHVVRLNEPLLYQGSAVYITHHGQAPQGLRLRVTGNGVDEIVNVAFRGEPGGQFRGYRLVPGRMIPDFALDDRGNAYSASPEYRNPALALEVFRGDETLATGWVFLRYPNRRAAAFDGYELFFGGVDYRPYAVFTINRDPGAVIALIGSLLFLVALIALLLMRGEGAELVTGRDVPDQPADRLSRAARYPAPD